MASFAGAKPARLPPNTSSRSPRSGRAVRGRCRRSRAHESAARVERVQEPQSLVRAAPGPVGLERQSARHSGVTRASSPHAEAPELVLRQVDPPERQSSATSRMMLISCSAMPSVSARSTRRSRRRDARHADGAGDLPAVAVQLVEGRIAGPARGPAAAVDEGASAARGSRTRRASASATSIASSPGARRAPRRDLRAAPASPEGSSPSARSSTRARRRRSPRSPAASRAAAP